MNNSTLRKPLLASVMYHNVQRTMKIVPANRLFVRTGDKSMEPFNPRNKNDFDVGTTYCLKTSTSKGDGFMKLSIRAMDG